MTARCSLNNDDVAGAHRKGRGSSLRREQRVVSKANPPKHGLLPDQEDRVFVGEVRRPPACASAAARWLAVSGQIAASPHLTEHADRDR